MIYQDLEDLVDAVQKKGKSDVDRFDASVFNGDYVTGDVTPGYLSELECQRNDAAKGHGSESAGSVIELHNTT